MIFHYMFDIKVGDLNGLCRIYLLVNLGNTNHHTKAQILESKAVSVYYVSDNCHLC